MIPKNYMFATANPRAGWLKSRYIDTDANLFKENIKRISTSIYTNLKNLGPEYENLINTASKEFKKQYFDGDWTLNSGLIYSEFNASNIEDGGNVVNSEWEIETAFNPSKFKTIVSIDPGYVKSKYVAILSAILADGTIYIFGELSFNGKNRESFEKIGPDEFSEELKKKYKEFDFKPDISIIDPAAHDPNGGIGSIAGRMIKNGIHVVSAKKTHEYDCILNIKTLFKNKKILINTRCSETIKELGLFRWDERKVIKGDQKPVDDDNDFCDAIRYIYAVQPNARKIPIGYESVFHQTFDTQKQLSGFMKECMPIKKPKGKRSPLDWGF